MSCGRRCRVPDADGVRRIPPGGGLGRHGFRLDSASDCVRSRDGTLECHALPWRCSGLGILGIALAAGWLDRPCTYREVANFQRTPPTEACCTLHDPADLAGNHGACTPSGTPSAGLPSQLTQGANAKPGVHVYHGVSDGKPVYDGITSDRGRRQIQHGDRFVVQQVTSSPVSRGQARAIKQALIVRNPGFQYKINQQQVNAAGQRVGINRPDLQYTVDGRRYYIEYEGVGAPRGPSHATRITANDPNAIVIVREVP